MTTSTKKPERPSDFDVNAAIGYLAIDCANRDEFKMVVLEINRARAAEAELRAEQETFLKRYFHEAKAWVKERDELRAAHAQAVKERDREAEAADDRLRAIQRKNEEIARLTAAHAHCAERAREGIWLSRASAKALIDDYHETVFTPACERAMDELRRALSTSPAPDEATETENIPSAKTANSPATTNGCATLSGESHAKAAKIIPEPAPATGAAKDACCACGEPVGGVHGDGCNYFGEVMPNPACPHRAAALSGAEKERES